MFCSQSLPFLLAMCSMWSLDNGVRWTHPPMAEQVVVFCWLDSTGLSGQPLTVAGGGGGEGSSGDGYDATDSTSGVSVSNCNGYSGNGAGGSNGTCRFRRLWKRR